MSSFNLAYDQLLIHHLLYFIKEQPSPRSIDLCRQILELEITITDQNITDQSAQSEDGIGTLQHSVP